LGDFFCQLGYFWKPIVTFCKDEVTQRNGDILGYFLLMQFFLHFHLNKQFQTVVCCGHLRFQKMFDVDFFNFHIELSYRYFGLFWLGDCFGYFFQNLDKFFSNRLVTLPPS